MLSGPQQLQWRDAFFAAFSEQEFTDLLWYRLGERTGAYASATKSFQAVIGEIVDAYSRRDLEDVLIAKAVETRPRNSALLRLASGKSAAVAPEETVVERLIQESNSFLDLGAWLEAAGRLQVCVCRIEIALKGGRTVYGTGFLVGADLVMTNWHVVQCIAAAEDGDESYRGPRAKAADALCRFDYKVLSNGVVNPGSTFVLAKEWRVLLSPNNPVGQEPGIDQLDCAVIRLEQPVGNLVVGDKLGVPGDLRGWIHLPDAQSVPELVAHSPLFIIQHPDGNPIKLALDTDSIQSVNTDRTRMRYSTNTESGSSGSPCFDQNWNLAALHHAGDPNFELGHKPAFNEGIPIDAVVGLLARQGINLE